MKYIEIEVECLSTKNSEIGDRILYSRDGIEENEELIGTVCRILDGKVFARVEKEYIMKVIDCSTPRTRDRKPAHSRTKVFI